MKAVTDYINKMRAARLPDVLADDLKKVLCGELNWTTVEEAPKAHECRAYEADAGDWHLALVDFSIADQPGRKPGDRGQNLAMCNRQLGVMLVGDDELHHQLARYLLQGITAKKAKKALFGTGNVPGLRVCHIEQKGERFNIDSPETLQKAIDWLENHIVELDGMAWSTTDGCVFQFDSEHKIAHHWGTYYEATYVLLELMGWTIIERKITDSRN